MAQNKKFRPAVISTVSVFAVLAVALSVAATTLKSMANTYLGKGEATVIEVEGSDQWDTNYYNPSFSDTTGSRTNAEAVTKKLCDEGFVLMKNNRNALPLAASSTTVSLIGRGAVDPLYGGSGSGNVDASKAATPYTGLKQAGFKMDDASYDYFNKEKDKYERCSITMDKYNSSQWLIGEIANTDPSNKPFTVAGDVAVYVISRAGGEGGDLSSDLKREAAQSEKFAEVVKSGTAKAEYDTYEDGQHQLELSAYEKNWIKFCEANYKKTVVIINSSNAMELGELQNDDKIDAVLWVGGPGSTGFNALGDILAGKVNPSGRTADIYAADFTKDPTFVNASVERQYTDIGEGDILVGDSGVASAYMTQYEEGIYIGYRYYETAAAEGVIDYDASVVYPFGYGLSYTTFEKSVKWSETSESVTATVTVKNTGKTDGKEVVQLYYSAPYTKGGIEKSAVVLGDFAKTVTLKAGESAEVVVTVDKKDMASYDYKGLKVQNGGYVLEKGEYTLSIRENSHVISDATNATYQMNVGSDIIYNQNTSREDGDLLIEKEAAHNRFNDVSAIFKDTPSAGYALNMSRADFKGTAPTAPTAADLTAAKINLSFVDEAGKNVNASVKDLLKPYVPGDNLDESATMPKTGASNGYVLSNMRGLSYNDPVWEDFLDQLTEEDYMNAGAYLVSGAYNNAAIESLGKPRVEDHDGPQGFSVLFGARPDACAYCSEVVIASTFNKELAKEMGTAIGEEALQLKWSGWYGPAMNTHRSPFAGRNFEYYSEDPVLSGKIATEVVEGAADKGCYAFIKHFALNDTEVRRTSNQCTWANEQTMREIYFKPFQMVVENAVTTIKYIADTDGTVISREMPACTAVMSSFNRIGTVWAGGSYALQTEVLRNEWGFRGFVISDFNLYGYMNADQGCRAGTDLQLTFGGNFADNTNATTRQATRTAIKNICYTVANSNVQQGVAPGSIVVYGIAWWQVAVIVFDVVAGLVILAGLAYLFLPFKKN